MIQQGQLLAVFNSVHRVMKAEHILKRCDISILLIPAPRALSTDCGLAIRFDSDLYDRVLQTLTAEKTPPAFIYRTINNSDYELIWNADTIDDTDS